MPVYASNRPNGTLIKNSQLVKTVEIMFSRGIAEGERKIQGRQHGAGCHVCRTHRLLRSSLYRRLVEVFFTLMGRFGHLSNAYIGYNMLCKHSLPACRCYYILYSDGYRCCRRITVCVRFSQKIF